MTDVMQKRRRKGVARAFAADALPEGELVMNLTEPSNEELHHVRGSERVGEPCVLRAGERQAGEAELPDATQPLNLRCLQEAHDDRFLFVLEGDQPVHRIAEKHPPTVPIKRP